MEVLQDKKNGTIIEVKNIVKQFGNSTVVDDVNLKIKRGEFVTLLGPSGCGKTTLLRMIGGFENPTSGQVLIEGIDMTDVPPNKRSINTVFQKYALFPHLNVYKNIAFGLKLKRNVVDGKSTKLSKSEIDDKVRRGLRMVGLEGYSNRNVDSLSGGQQQRVAIARALVCEPKVLLLDEPLGALDLKMRKEMQVELKSMHRNLGITFLYVTHDQEEALTMSDTVVVMRDGTIQQIGTPQKIYDEPVNAYVADFIGESNILSGIMREDYKVEIFGQIVPCSDKGFEKDERVDLVVRPEDIRIVEEGLFEGKVVASIFKGDYYEMRIMVDEYEFTVQSTQESKISSNVFLSVRPQDIHIMKKDKVVNSYRTVVSSAGVVEICGGRFECNTLGLNSGDEIIAEFGFDSVALTDHETDGVIGGNIAVSLYKGKYYQVQVYTDDDNDMLVNTIEDWDIGDRVGINIKSSDIKVTSLSQERENNG